MNVKAIIPLALALVLGLVAALVARSMMSQNKGPSQPDGKFTQIVTVKDGVAPGTELTPAELHVGQILAESAPEGTFTNINDVAGRVTTLQLVKGQPVIESLLAPIGTGSGLQALVPEGMRAITVEVNEFSGVAGLLLPGCNVDVIATIIDSEDEEKLARTIVENVRVISVGQRMSSKDEGEEGERMSKSVTLIASPQDAEAIELAAATGRPRLVLRGGNDQASAATDGVTLAELRGAPKRHIDPFTHPVMQYIPQPSTQPTNVEQPEEKPLIKASAPEPKVRYRHVQVIRNGVESNVSFVDPVTAPAGKGLITTTGSEVNN